MLLSYHYSTWLNLENFAFLPLLRTAGIKKFCVRTTTTRTTETLGWT